MRYAIIADIHANLPALQVVLKDIEAQNCAQTVCLGDIVGYYSQPKECVDIIRRLGIPCVKGNHDDYCSSEMPHGFNPDAAGMVRWTRDQLSEDDRKWLRELPYVKEVAGFTIVHATLDHPERWAYVFERLAAAAHFQHQAASVCFFGHTHVPVAFVRDSSVRGGTFTKFKVESGKQYFVNPGSVGQPRDNNPKASYVIYDLGEHTMELRRLDYPKSETGEGGRVVPTPKGPPLGKPPSLSSSSEAPD